jgi:very-short-patch-repair endonuclease
MPIGRYIVDFCCPDAWLVVEVDGGQHTLDAVAARDAQRTKELECLGYLVVRFWNPEIFANLDGVCETILGHLRGEAGA